MRRLAILLVLVAGCCVPMAKPSPPNAKCPACDHVWRIPVHHGIGAWNVDYRCPNCHCQTAAQILYNNARGEF